LDFCMENVVLPLGYRFAGIHAGIKPDPSRLDLGLLVSDAPAVAAGVFTQNRVRAAPVKISSERVPTANARGVVISSGNANACTGEQGLENGRRMTVIAADSVGCQAQQFLVCSTGVIGRQLPMNQIEPGIRTAAGRLGESPKHFDDLAHAILTTDTRIKVSFRLISHPGRDIRVTGFAKGAAMIGPNLATMLAFVFTDAAITPVDLAAIVKRAADATFNCISVEGHTSTNDTLLFFANGRAEAPSAVAARLNGWEGECERFEIAAMGVCADLAQAIAADAEGATHLVRIEVEGLRSDTEARQVAKTVADSALVKTAIFGADPNWGRFASAAGYSGVIFEEHNLSVWLGDMLLYGSGIPQSFDSETASAYLKNNREVRLLLQFNLGTGRCTHWTCDLGYEYIRLNAEYTT
jgi:glutamate N-acetyltransferase/amino-acid N-acetyltransferase